MTGRAAFLLAWSSMLILFISSSIICLNLCFLRFICSRLWSLNTIETACLSEHPVVVSVLKAWRNSSTLLSSIKYIVPVQRIPYLW